nr:hypothetical protein [Candidatus Cloacimonadota bacterium]
MLDSEFRDGKLEFVAPESATIYINGKAIEGNYAFDYDSDPFMAYPITVPLNKESVQQGKNTIRFVVNNNSAYRGFIAAVTIIKAGKEELR